MEREGSYGKILLLEGPNLYFGKTLIVLKQELKAREILKMCLECPCS